MTRLLAYLDESGWKTTKKGTRTTVKDTWVYDWRVRGDLSDLWKWHQGKGQWKWDEETGKWIFQPDVKEDMQMHVFVIGKPLRCLEIAQNINSGVHPEPHTDARSKQGTISFL
jgi:hypothetical protein